MKLEQLMRRANKTHDDVEAHSARMYELSCHALKKKKKTPKPKKEEIFDLHTSAKKRKFNLKRKIVDKKA